ncbi:MULTISPECIES: B12-binding domain-containing radical SAM protein [Ruminococcus]|uniref:B12-binding domain-containing radical SAM protein n=1 Tax=Ruminococcus hominis TaxID=2763065 RepID=A0ABR7G4B5_9FIRM|nr:B12-binding domain-containing radical SAM protein [Ruminococcus hominis]MBC5682280.1 B12-binding domain-containing radical SAM protein [Ruminococcus hominis]
MNILLTAINAKYIHSNLAVYSLRAYAAGKCERYKEEIGIAEYTINQPLDQILMDLYKRKPEVLCFSCYLWNIEYVEQLVAELGKIMPQTDIWLGGPEVSYHASHMLEQFPQVYGIMRGEGEETFLELAEFYYNNSGKSLEQCEKVQRLKEIVGITFRDGEEIIETADRSVMDLSKVPFVYEDLDVFKNKIIYYESSRGCPFSCSYCLSSIDKCLRFRDLELVKKELQFFIDHEIPQVKFVDRTFNCKHSHSMEIWSYIKEHDKGKTNFHFEVAADLLNEEELNLISTMRPGLIQLEIGVQSTNEQTIKEIHRTMKFSQVTEVVNRVHAAKNIHQHLDLIAGLPFEDYNSFHKSFCDVYALRPEQLQLGFLKVLKGSYMEEKTKDYELLYQNRPPYEVLSTKWLPYSDVIRLKGLEEMVEVYYNSRQFEHTMELLEQVFGDAFVMFEEMSNYYEEHGYYGVNHNRVARYEILYAFIKEVALVQYETLLTEEQFRQTLVMDLYLRENMKNRPAFAGDSLVSKEVERTFYDTEAEEHQYLKGYEKYDKRQLRKMTHLENIDGHLILFDYQNRNPLTNQATTYEVI